MARPRKRPRHRRHFSVHFVKSFDERGFGRGGEVGDELAPDDVGEAAFEAAHGVAAGLAGGSVFGEVGLGAGGRSGIARCARRAMNKAVVIDKQSPVAVAGAFLKANGLAQSACPLARAARASTQSDPGEPPRIRISRVCGREARSPR
jgi:hypothetical protein